MRDEENIGNLVIQKDIALVKAITDTRESLLKYLDISEKVQLKSPDDKQIVTDMITSIKNICKPIIELIEPIKKQANEQIEKILSVEKIFITYVPPNQATKTRADERFLAWKIIDILTHKLNAYLDYEEEQRRIEEKRLQELAEKARQKEIEQISRKLDTMLEKVSNLQEQKKILEEQLNQDITDEEAEQIRRRIETIEIKLRPSQEKILEAQTKLEEKATSVAVTLDKGPKTPGLSADNFYWEIDEIVNIKLICKQVWEGTLPPACISVNIGKLKSIANDMVKGTNNTPNIPGVQFVKKRKIVIRNTK